MTKLIRRKLSDQDGLSLLEVLVAMILTSVSLLVLLNLAMIALDGTDWSNNATAVTQMMQQKLEEVRARNDAVGSYSESDGKYGLAWDVDSVAAFLKEVNMEVTWQDVRGKDKVDSMTAFFKTP